MDYLSHCLQAIIKRLEEQPAFLEIFPLEKSADLMPFQPLLNHHLIHAAFIAVDDPLFCRIHNDAAAAFFGMPDPDVSSQNLGFYYRHVHFKHYPFMIQAQFFFMSGSKGEFRCQVELKDGEGVYHPIKAAFQARPWNGNGKDSHAIVVGAPVQDLLYYEAYEHYALENLGERTLAATRLLCQGRSNQEIADELGYSVKSVEKELSQLFQCSQTRNRGQFLEPLGG